LHIQPWGNGLGLRITKAMAKVAGVVANSPARVTVASGRLIIETVSKQVSLTALLADFDPQRHGGEVMAFVPMGKEAMQRR
jgi:antitoxin MazE